MTILIIGNKSINKQKKIPINRFESNMPPPNPLAGSIIGL